MRKNRQKVTFSSHSSLRIQLNRTFVDESHLSIKNFSFNDDNKNKKTDEVINKAIRDIEIVND